MSSSSSSLAAIGGAIIERFETTNSARDRALNEGRQITRLSANTVRAIHRAEFEDAEMSLAEAKRLLQGLIDHLTGHPNLYWQGYVQDATKEYAEACITMAMVRGAAIPSPKQLGVEDAPYLNGLAEAASELRREVLDNLRAGRSARAEELLVVMDDVYDLLVSIDFPDGITGGRSARSGRAGGPNGRRSRGSSPACLWNSHASATSRLAARARIAPAMASRTVRVWRPRPPAPGRPTPPRRQSRHH